VGRIFSLIKIFSLSANNLAFFPSTALCCCTKQNEKNVLLSNSDSPPAYPIHWCLEKPFLVKVVFKKVYGIISRFQFIAIVSYRNIISNLLNKPRILVSYIYKSINTWSMMFIP